MKSYTIKCIYHIQIQKKAISKTNIVYDGFLLQWMLGVLERDHLDGNDSPRVGGPGRGPPRHLLRPCKVVIIYI